LHDVAVACGDDDEEASTATAQSGSANTQLSAEETRNLATFRRLVEEGLSKGVVEVVDENLTPDSIDHQYYGPGFPLGRDGVKALVAILHTAMPDFRSEIRDAVAVGDKTWGRVKSSGTHTGPYLGVPPTGRKVEIDVMDIIRYDPATGKVVEHWGISANLDLLNDMGLLPAAPVYSPDHVAAQYKGRVPPAGPLDAVVPPS
jgi:predicted ester cyclase